MAKKNRSIVNRFAGVAVCLTILFCFTGVAIAEYNTYYGTLHNHSTVSDGSGDPEEAYEYARDSGELDFFGLSDHARQISQNEWADIKSTADSFNEGGVYVTFWGFEWSSSNDYGHITVINTPDYCDAYTNATDTFDELMTWLSSRDGLAFLNHPGREDTGHEFNHFDPDTPFLHLVAGIELFNKSSGFSTYYYNDGYFSNDGGLGFYDEALTRGWDIGASGAEDHHGTRWGTATDYRLAILAEELTRDSLFNAMKARRFFSTEDKNLTLSFEVSGEPMGSFVSPGNLNCVIQAGDGDSENFDKIQLIKNGTVLHNWSINDPAPNIVQNLTAANGDYFYVKVTQQDNDEAISAPIFIVGEPEPDEDPPTPDPSSWAVEPHGTDPSTISMTATTAEDASAVQYYFECLTAGCHDSGWQSSPTYVDSGLDLVTSYTYRTMARDTSPDQNETGWSDEATGTTIEEPPDVVTITKAEYKDGDGKLKVEATSSENGDVDLEVMGFGPMEHKKDKYKYEAKGVNCPGTVVVESTGGGTDSVWVCDLPEPDVDPPTPDPSSWAVEPHGTGPSTISMKATPADDASGVEYYFECLTAGCHDSGWQSSPTYVDSGLDLVTSYTYRTMARDTSPDQNETGWSGEATGSTIEQPPDEVFIKKAEFKRKKGELKVEAKGDKACNAEFTIVGYGTMECKKGKHKYKEKGVPDPNGTVTVTSSLGGLATHPVKYK